MSNVSRQVKLYLLLALAAVAAGSQMNKIAVADEGGIPPLVEVLMASDDL